MLRPRDEPTNADEENSTENCDEKEEEEEKTIKSTFPSTSSNLPDIM